MSTLYRCRARVGYRPTNSDKLILFDEKQIQELSVKLKWNNTFAAMNSQGGTYSAAAFSSSINQSKCQVTLSDPYMTGIAWPALFDASSMWSVSSMAQTNNIIMRQCGEGEDPVVDKCFNYNYIDESGEGAGSTPGEFKETLAHLLISLWYDINGTEFGTDYYFRVTRIAISNGAGIPSVTIAGSEPKAIVFNQNLVNLSFDEGITVEDALKKIAEESGFTASFCTPPTSAPPQKYVLPRKVAYKGVTPDEAMKKILASTGGSMLSLPVKEHANKISVCSRGDLIQSCTVFYLGRGLYQSYEISGEPPNNFAHKNTQQGAMVNNSDAYVSASFAAEKYKVQDVVKDKRVKALASVKKMKFPGLFEPCEKRCQGPTKDGYGWAGAGPEVDNKKFTDSNMYGISPNGTKAISFLPGRVESVGKEQGSVVIKTEFWLQIGKVDDSEKFFGRVIFQETTNLSEVKVKAGDSLTTSQEVGSSTEEKKEFTRFYIFGHNNTMVTLDPEIVWGFASPIETAATFAPKAAPVSSGGEGGGAAVATGSSSSTPATTTTTTTTTPTTTTTTTAGGSDKILIGKIGDTGNSRGPHLHAEWVKDRRAITPADVYKYVEIDASGRPIPTSGHKDLPGGREGHRGTDIAADLGTPVYIKNGASVVSVQEGYSGGFGNNVIISTPEGEMRLAHLQDKTIPPGLPGLSTSASGGKNSGGVASAPSIKSLSVETKFKGVPRALRITPGRTILSFVTDYDAWLDEDGHKGSNSSIDPGVWIPQKFRNWFVTEADFSWRLGDLVVSLTGANAWGNAIISAPSFSEYLNTKKQIGEFSKTNDYYGYIRSAGDLCYPIKKSEGGGWSDSCTEQCAEAQQFYQKYGDQNPPINEDGTTPPGSVESSYGPANCTYTGSKYPADRVNAIIRASQAGGINTKAGFAGVVGNALKESTTSLNPAISNFEGSGAFGVFQWLNSRRAGLGAHARGLGKSPSDFDAQMSWFVKELKGADFAGPSTVQQLNQATDPSAAAFIFGNKFERALIDKNPNSLQGRAQREAFAREIFNDLTCNKP